MAKKTSIKSKQSESHEEKGEKLASGFFSRSRELISLAANVGAKELGGRVTRALGKDTPLQKLNTQMEQARLVMECLGRLKGAAMKVGQMLSIEGRDFLPPEVIQVLNQLQSQAEPVHFTEIVKVLKSELGETGFAKIEKIDPRPLASASIGQVHRAKFQGRDIVLKVQYPGVAESIGSDLKILEKISTAMLGLGGKKIQLEALFQELEQVLMQEADYRLEAKLMTEYASLLDSRAAEFCVPNCVPELSTQKVLGMSFESGMHLDTYLASHPPLEQRNLFAKRVLDLYMDEFFQYGLVQTDPNFSNFLFRPETGQLVILDFGATRRYTQEFRKNYRELLLEIRRGSQESIVKKSAEMGLIDLRESPECLAAFTEMLVKSSEPFEAKLQPFRFADRCYVAEARRSVTNFTKLIKYSPPPHQLIFLHRKLSGVFNMLKSLEASLDLRSYWKFILEEPHVD